MSDPTVSTRPPQPRPLRIWQFGLGGLFRAVTLSAALLGIVLCAVHSGGCGSTSKGITHLEFSPNGEDLLIQVASSRYDQFADKGWKKETTLETILLAIKSQSRTVIDRQVSRGRCVPGSVGFLPNGEDVALGSLQGVRYWRRHGPEPASAELLDLQGRRFQFSPARNYVAVVQQEEVQIKQCATGQTVGTMPNRAANGFPHHMALADDGHCVAVDYYDKVDLHRVTTRELFHVWSSGPDYPLRLCDMSRDGTRALLDRPDGLHLGQVGTAELTKVLDEYYTVHHDGNHSWTTSQSGDDTYAAKFSPDGRQFVAAGEYGVQIFDAETGQPSGEPLSEEWSADAAFSPDGKTLVTSDREGDLIVWDVESRRKIEHIPIPGNFRTPWTVPLALFGVWLLACWRFSPLYRLGQSGFLAPVVRGEG